MPITGASEVLPGIFYDKGGVVLSVAHPDFGAACDGTTNDTAAINAAIDYAAARSSGNAIVSFPIGSVTKAVGIVLKPGVTLVGSMSGRPGATLQLYSPGTLIDTPATQSNHMGVAGLALLGFGASGAGIGLRIRNGYWNSAERLFLNNFADAGLQTDATTVSCWINRIIAYNCVQNRTRAAVQGAIDLDGTDHMVHGLESTASVTGTKTSASLYCAALAIRMANGFVDAVQAETSDVGLYVSGSQNRFTACRADTNMGHGFQIVGNGNQFVTPYALNNSQDTTNGFDHYYVSGTNNDFVKPKAENGAAKVARYFINDASSAGDTNKNEYLSPRMVGTANGTADYNAVAGGPAISFADGPPKTLTVNSATPSVTGYRQFLTANSSATTITNFTGGVEGQIITVDCRDANTLIEHNTVTITLPWGGSLKMRSGAVYQFRLIGGVWRPLGDAQYLQHVSGDNGDTSSTIAPRAAESTQRWLSPLTATRTVTLNTAGATSGSRFRIVRGAAATGAFNLNVGTGPLKALTAAGQWCDVEYDGAAWVLSAYGAL